MHSKCFGDDPRGPSSRFRRRTRPRHVCATQQLRFNQSINWSHDRSIPLFSSRAPRFESAQLGECFVLVFHIRKACQNKSRPSCELLGVALQCGTSKQSQFHLQELNCCLWQCLSRPITFLHIAKTVCHVWYTYATRTRCVTSLNCPSIHHVTEQFPIVRASALFPRVALIHPVLRHIPLPSTAHIRHQLRCRSLPRVHPTPRSVCP